MIQQPKALTTTIPALDEALGIGGISLGGIHEIAGPRSPILGLAIAAEHKGSLLRLDELGSDLEDTLAEAEKEARVPGRVVVVVGLDAKLPTAPAGARPWRGHLDYGVDPHQQFAERILAARLRKLCSLCSTKGSAVIFAHEQRLRGSNAIRFYSTMRIALEPESARVIKNKLAPPFTTAGLFGWAP